MYAAVSESDKHFCVYPVA